MTPDQERALLDATAKGLDDDLRKAYQELIQLIRSGVPPRDAVNQVMESFSKEYAQLLSDAFSGVLAMSIGTEAALAMEVGTVQLSAKLYAQSMNVGQIVQGLADKHLKGFSDARALALQLFEGYGFRPPDAEPLQFNPSNPALPKYLREALLSDSGMQGQMTKAFSKLQVDGLKSEALRAAYAQVLDALDKVQQGAGQDLLDKRLKIAFFERMRYFANRIVQTEIHKAYMKREAQLLMDDEEVEFVQIRRNPTSDSTCICTLYAGRDRFGMGKGVYPKRAAPVPPFHPHCRCVLSPRLDLTGKKAKPENPESDRYFLHSLGAPMAAQVVGSQDKLERVLRSGDATQVYNAGMPSAYQVQTVGQVTKP